MPTQPRIISSKAKRVHDVFTCKFQLAGTNLRMQMETMAFEYGFGGYAKRFNEIYIQVLVVFHTSATSEDKMAKFFEVITCMETYEEIEPLQRSSLDQNLRHIKEKFKVYKVNVRIKCPSGGSEDPDDAISLRSHSDSFRL